MAALFRLLFHRCGIKRTKQIDDDTVRTGLTSQGNTPEGTIAGASGGCSEGRGTARE